jgi:hypothetical protein
MKVRLEIERLVVDGLPLSRGEAGRLRSAVEAELVRLLADGGLGVQGGAIASVAGPTVPVGDGRDPVAVGTQVARAVYGSL